MARNLVQLQRLIAAETTDAELLHRFVESRDELAFAELLQRHLPHVYRICRRQLDATTADDAVQATFIVFACRAHRIQKSSSLGSWLIGVADRVSRQMRRRQRTTVALPDVPAVASSDSFEARELASVLDEEVAKLPDHLRDVMVECCLHERTYDEAASVLGTSSRTVRRRLLEAKQRLRRRLESRGVVPIVAMGLVSGFGCMSIAVPPTLATITFESTMQVLVGGSLATPPILLAKGFLMTYTYKLVAKSVVALALGVTALGWAIGDDLSPAPKPTPPTVTPKGDERAPSPKVDLPKVEAPLPLTVPVPTFTPAPIALPKVPDPQAPRASAKNPLQRAIDAEVQYQRQQLRSRYFNNSSTPPMMIAIDTRYEKAKLNEEISTYTFTENREDNKPVLISYSGDFAHVLTHAVPHSILQICYHEHAGQPLPLWAFGALPKLLLEPREVHKKLDAELRLKLNAGKALRLEVLFESKSFQSDHTAQSLSVMRYLMWRSSQRVSTTTAILMSFIKKGQTAQWENAAREFYGFQSLDEMQTLWIEWLKSPASRITEPTDPSIPPLPSLTPPAPKPTFIAPISVDDDPKPDAASPLPPAPLQPPVNKK
jgi:RNA polymerase sigma factor (sigma-70 family)